MVLLMPPPYNVTIFLRGGALFRLKILQGRYLGKIFLFKNVLVPPDKILNEKRGGLIRLFLIGNKNFFVWRGFIPYGGINTTITVIYNLIFIADPSWVQHPPNFFQKIINLNFWQLSPLLFLRPCSAQRGKYAMKIKVII